MRGTVDFHAHLIDAAVYRETQNWSVFAQTTDAARAAKVLARMADVEERIAAMDTMGVGVQVLSSSLVHQCTYDMAPQDARRLDAAMNDTIGRAVAAHPDRFRGLGSVPLQSAGLAVAELTRCLRDLGLSGVTISTRVREAEIGDASLRPFWEAAEAFGAVVFIHPAGNHHQRFRKWQLWNSIGQSFEEAMAIASLFYEGILDAYPKLKILLSHGGGYMPFYLGRIARNYAEKPATRTNMTRPPIEYLRMLHYDTCVYDPDTLAHLVEIVGAERIVTGSDYPVGETNPVEFVRECATLDETGRHMVLAGNAARLLDIRSPD